MVIDPDPAMDLSQLPPAASATRLPLRFSGAGAEYFRIWIVNLALTVATLGIYSAWAKVRREQYFHRHTTLDGSAFDYHGDPVAILKGRVIACVLLLAYYGAGHVSGALQFAAFLALAAAAPFLFQRSLRFRLHNTSWRGLRFAFDGDLRGAYRTVLFNGVAVIATFGLLLPWWMREFLVWRAAHARLGDARFELSLTAGAVFGVYLRAAGLMLGVGLVMGVLMPFVAGVLGTAAGVGAGAGGARSGVALLIGVASVLAIYLAMFALYPYFQARMQNTVWNAMRIGQHGFASTVSARRLIAIHLSNLVLIVLTLGLYKPFATIRLLRYRIECLSLAAAGPLDALLAGAHTPAAAGGEEVADLFDVDIGL